MLTDMLRYSIFLYARYITLQFCNRLLYLRNIIIGTQYFN